MEKEQIIKLLKSVYEAGMDGIYYVGQANWFERQQKAKHDLINAYNNVIKEINNSM